MLAPLDAAAGLCTGTTTDILNRLNNKLKYVGISTDADGNPLVILQGANVQRVSSNAGNGTGNLIVGNFHIRSGATDGFVAGHSQLIFENSPSACRGYKNAATGYYISITGSSTNKASYNFATVSGGRDNKASCHYATILPSVAVSTTLRPRTGPPSVTDITYM
ncbi:MAG: hypothetical protein JXR76_28885 [Deltaproteobacteria bacterium]|nr:hypothetical protein [Deltaproteobacteria bacterium]